MALIYTEHVDTGIAHTGGFSGKLFPIVGMSSTGHITANFGAKPFEYAPDTADADTTKTAVDMPAEKEAAEDKYCMADRTGGVSDDPSSQPPLDALQDNVDSAPNRTK